MKRLAYHGLRAWSLVLLGLIRWCTGNNAAPFVASMQPQAAASQTPKYSSPQDLKVLESSTDRSDLQRAAIALASSDNSQDLAILGEFLRKSDFLSRLDDLGSPHAKTLHLRKVMETLVEHPSTDVAKLCLSLGRDAVFLGDPDRELFLLLALANVKPMSAETATRFREANAGGYFATNAPLLANNGSPRALDLFESMMKDESIPAARRVACLHSAVVPNRSNVPVLKVAQRLLSGTLDRDVSLGLIESIFDYQGKKWFGSKAHPPAPPPWDAASDEAIKLVIHLADATKPWNVPAQLRTAMDHSLETLQGILLDRKARKEALDGSGEPFHPDK